MGREERDGGDRAREMRFKLLLGVEAIALIPGRMLLFLAFSG